MNQLTTEEKRIIEEEVTNLRKLQNFLSNGENLENREILKQQLTDLHESTFEVPLDEIPQLDQQLVSLRALVNRYDEDNQAGQHFVNPYFARMRLLEEKAVRDLYLGNQVYRSPDSSIQIIDWKTSPIAMIYFLYEQGDDYEEEISGRLFKGQVEIKRMIKIEKSEIIGIRQGELCLLKKTDSGWYKQEKRSHLLKSSSDLPTRQNNTVFQKSEFNINHQVEIKKDKLLTEITGLIDPEQFKLITQPEAGIVAVQGSAGSGKTTVALHRMAWLHFKDIKRFAAESMMVIVYNEALANYVSKVLPSLQVENVEIEFFENWASKIRIRLMGHQLSKNYSEQTPGAVVRFKKHPAVFKIINEYLEEKEAGFERNLNEILHDSKKAENFPRQELKNLPFIKRLHILSDWLEGKKLFQGEKFDFGVEVKSSLQRLIYEYIDPENSQLDSVIHYWEELFSNFTFLKKRFQELAGNDLAERTLNEVIEWLRHRYALRLSSNSYRKLELTDSSRKHDLLELVSGEKKNLGEEIGLDYEDDPILLYFYQKLFKEIRKRSGAKLEFSHLMVDEVQDLSPIELAVLLNMMKEPLSLTLAGDVNQKVIEHSGFQNWDLMFKNLNLEGQKVFRLNVSYRSTFEIMDFAYAILGDLADDYDFTTTRHGSPVEMFQFSSQGELVYFLIKSLRELSLTEFDASVAVICANIDDAETYYELLHKMELSDLRLVKDQDFLFIAGIDITEVGQVKGLEFDYVILLDVDTTNYPNNNYSRYLLHMASTRAAHQLWLLSYREPSSLLPAWLTERMTL